MYMWPDQYERIAGADCIVVHKVHHDDVSQCWKEGRWGVKREGDRAEEDSDTKGASRDPGPVSRGFPHIVVQPKRLQLLLCTLFCLFVLSNMQIVFWLFLQSSASKCKSSANLHIICFLEVQWHPLMQNNLFKCLSAGCAKTRFGLQAQGLVRNWADPLREKS